MLRREFLAKMSGLAAAGMAAGLFAPAGLRAAAQPAQSPKKKMNVLFIAVDDLRPQLGCYGRKLMVTPNLDKLAAEGALFMSTYCQQAVCSPTRSSLLTGTRPDTTKVYDLVTHFRSNIPDVVTLPQHFKNNGYHSQGIGKLYHGGYDDPPSWTVPWTAPGGKGYALEENSRPLNAQPAPAKAAATAKAKAKGKGRKKASTGPRGLPYECADVPDNVYGDGACAEQAIEILKRIKDKPFFFGVGFIKPHLPFNSPKKYWDLYDESKIELDNPDPIKGVPEFAPTTWGELRNYRGMPKQGPVPEADQRKLLHAYYAATSFTDANIGKLLQALEEEGLKDNTIVIVWGDHGWHLGDHNQWCKHTNFENATHACMLMRVPGKPAGIKVTGLTEFVDIYPTLCELAGLELPAHLEGTSFAPLLADPTRKWKKAAFSQYPRNNMMGYTLRTERYRYTEWLDKQTRQPQAFELYDYEKDPGENANHADEEQYRTVRAELAALMKAGWRGAKP